MNVEARKYVEQLFHQSVLQLSCKKCVCSSVLNSRSQYQQLVEVVVQGETDRGQAILHTLSFS